MDAKIIKTEAEYNEALSQLDYLMDAVPGTKEAEELELFALLIEKYEEEHFPISLPDPVEAIKFRMEQQGLTQTDLIPMIGSQSKVSEVLNRRRPLSLSMIRNLNMGLEIPAEVLIQEPGGKIPEMRFNPADYPFAELFNRGYFSKLVSSLALAKQQGEECLESLFSVFQGNTPEYVYCRSSEGDMDKYALAAWQARILALANEQEVGDFHAEQITPDVFKQIVHFSAYSTGPVKAQEYLRSLGIPLIILQHLPHTYLDGACFMDPKRRPVIGMTLRHDRLDNFWFTLIHELAHIYLHLLRGTDVVYFDDTEHTATEDCSPQEAEADSFTSAALIPNELWVSEKASFLETLDNTRIIQMAENLGISPAIIAGRVRHEKKDFSIYSNLIGNGTVRALFGGM